MPLLPAALLGVGAGFAAAAGPPAGDGPAAPDAPAAAASAPFAPAPAPSASAPSAPSASAPAPPPPPHRLHDDPVRDDMATHRVRSWDAAIGFVVSHGADYPGSDKRGSSISPGLAVRWGRWSFTSQSAFAVRSSDPAATGGLRLDLMRTERFRVGLALRYDRGRDESANEAYRGLGDVPGGVMLRVHPRYVFGDGWQLGGSMSFPLFGKGPGSYGEITLGRDMRLNPITTFGAGTSLTFGSHRVLQNYYGITPEQSARSGYPVYEAQAGLSALAFSAGARTDIGEDWVLLYGVSASRLLGSAAASPLTRQPASWGVNAGLVYHF